jgi:pimeloyl-ACP methyl ester carboxylesterase
MRVLVNGVRLYFDVEGAGLVPDGAAMRAKLTLILLHGGPGFDHTIHKPAFAAVADIAQVVYLDHRGNGRSARSQPGPRSGGFGSIDRSVPESVRNRRKQDAF